MIWVLLIRIYTHFLHILYYLCYTISTSKLFILVSLSIASFR